MARKKKRYKEGGQKLEIIEAVRFTTADHAIIADAARHLRLSRADVIRRSVALGIGTLKHAMSLITPVVEKEGTGHGRSV